MAMRVGELLGFSHLSLDLVAGSSGLGNRISWAYVSELENPVAFLEGGELILTGGVGISDQLEDQVAYLCRLDDVGASGIAIAQGRSAPVLSNAARDTADQLDLPLLQLPYEVPFLEIMRLVGAANEPAAQQRLLRHLQVLETLQAFQTTATPWSEILKRLTEVTGFELFVAGPAGGEILPGVPPPPPSRASSDRTRDPTIPGGYRLPIQAAGRTAANLVALRGSDRASPGLAAAQYVAVVLGVLFASVYQERETQRGRGAELFTALLAGEHAAGERRELLARVGLDGPGELRIGAIASHTGGVDDVEIHHRLCDRSQSSLLLDRDQLIALIPDTPQAIEAFVDAECDVSVGLSAPFSASDPLDMPVREARRSLEQAIANGQRSVHSRSEAIGEGWLPTSQAELSAAAASVLGPLIEYDAQRGGELVASLRVLFKHNRRMQAAAQELGIHPHTLAYRLRRVEELTGRDVHELSDLVDLWLAVRALEYSERIGY